ncbi:hypothetical protein ACFWPV_10010 [Streptomyces uncialis]|uniref:hypothetical protein n=1 Tax=Streptomyces uncialis TaxID=1048205 RepID=UPI00364E847D
MAEVYRERYGREPRKAFRLINGRFRRVMAYRIGEAEVLRIAWYRYARTAALTVPNA